MDKSWMRRMNWQWGFTSGVFFIILLFVGGEVPVERYIQMDDDGDDENL